MSNELIKKPGELMQYLAKAKGQIALALPKHLNPDRMLRLAVTCFSSNPGLKNCTPQSILSSIIVASQIGLEPGISGQGYLIPYGQTCTFIPGWQGLVSLLNNTGRATAWTGSVFEGDEFNCELGSMQRITHRPGPNYGDPAKLQWVYACGRVNGAEIPVIEAWPISRVLRHRDRFNKVGKRHYSFEHPEMYARKVVLLQVLKYMPKSIELQNAIAAVDASEEGKTTTVQDGVVLEAQFDTPPPDNGGEGQDGGPFAQQQGQGEPQGVGSGNVAEAEPPAQKPAESKAGAKSGNGGGEGGTAGEKTRTPPTSGTDELSLQPVSSLSVLRGRLMQAGITDAEVLYVCRKNKIPHKPSVDASGDALATLLLNDWDNLVTKVAETRPKA